MEQRRICPYCMQELEAGEEQCPHCGRELAGRNPSGSLPAGTVLAGRYTVGDIQSVDGEGILYRGVENNGPFRVTIKEYMPLTLAAERGRDCILRPKPGSEVLFKTTRMDFADLYRFIQRITPANGLEAVLDVFEENNTVYAVMENPGGRPLQKWLEEHGTVTPQQACAMLEPVFNGVEAMHQVGLVHRGICPANIRIMDNGRARLTGYATVGLRTAGSGLHEQLYEGYSAPEQYSTAEFEGRYTDEYSLAAVFYRMVCGLSPVPAAQRLVSDSNPKARTVTPSVPAYVSETLYLGLRLKPVERIQTVQQLFRALSEREYAEELSRSMEALDPPTPAPQEPKAPAKTELLSVRNLLAGIVILLSVLILLILWGLLSRGKDASREEYRRELEATVDALRCHPCIGCWVPFNEGWGQFDAAGAVQAIRTLDDTRLVDEASGWYDQGGGDVCSIHNYFYPLHVKPGKRTVALSEYGGIAWPMPGHEAPGKTYGYGTAKSRADLTARCKKLQLGTVLPQLKKGLSALVYTQLTDVEDEVNGLFTYDRAEIKPDANAVRSVNAALAAEFAKVTR